MMEAFSSSLHLALAISASPGAIIASIILLMTKRAIRNSYPFLLGWFIGLMLIGIIFLQRPGLYDSSGEPSVVLGWIRIILGTPTLITGLYMLKKIIKKEDQGASPKWADKVDSFGFFHALIVGFFFAAPNIKNASMVTTGAASIGNFGLGSLQEISVLILFCLVATIGVLVPPVIFLLFREKSEVLFGKMKVWLIRYSALILFVICFVFGGLFIYQGIHIVFT
jgi:hypothetical protein